MKLTDSYKQKLNILIPYYRNQNLKETGEGIWQQSAFYTNSDTKLPVCSSKLYCGLENNVCWYGMLQLNLLQKN